MTGQDIIDIFNTLTNFAAELSDTELLALLNKRNRFLLDDRDWNFLIKTDTGNVSTSVDYIAVPADFDQIVANKDGDAVIYIGSSYTPYHLVPFDDRRSYRNLTEYVYYDGVNRRLVFTAQPTTADSYEFDYKYYPDDLTTSTAILCPRDAWGWAVAHLMTTDFYSTDQTEKGRAYYNENMQKADELMEQLNQWDMRTKISI